MRKIAISDIHGHPRTFLALLDQIGLAKEDELYLLGDFVNKGPDSEGLLDQIISLQQQGFQLAGVRGNHDQMWLNEYEQGFRYLRESHRKFLEELPLYLHISPFWMVHAGFNFMSGDPLNDQRAMMSIRNWRNKLNYDWLEKEIILHGHVRRTRAQIELDVAMEGPVIDIDNGCFNVFEAGQGHLCALDLTNFQLWFQENLDHSARGQLYFPVAFPHQG
ncbi:MAG: metallophosphoesterase [Bacteroidota bacterium]